MHGRSKNISWSIQKKSIIDHESTAWLIQKKIMADPEKNNFVDPDPDWNYAIPDIPSTFPLTSPRQTKWLTGSHPTPARFCCVQTPSFTICLRPSYMRVLR